MMSSICRYYKLTLRCFDLALPHNLDYLVVEYGSVLSGATDQWFQSLDDRGYLCPSTAHDNDDTCSLRI